MGYLLTYLGSKKDEICHKSSFPDRFFPISQSSLRIWGPPSCWFRTVNVWLVLWVNWRGQKAWMRRCMSSSLHQCPIEEKCRNSRSLCLQLKRQLGHQVQKNPRICERHHVIVEWHSPFLIRTWGSLKDKFNQMRKCTHFGCIGEEIWTWHLSAVGHFCTSQINFLSLYCRGSSHV